MILGVCKGLADHIGISPFWVRMAALALLVFTAVAPVAVLYVLAAVIMKPEPVVPFQSEADEEFYNSFASSRTMALHRLQRTYERLDRRLRRMEDVVTARDYDWHARLNGSD
jgi:phage shock protein C